MTAPRRMLGRNPSAQYFTLEGLELLTGVSPEDFDKLVLKELMDNALDACDEILERPVIKIKVVRANGFLKIFVQDNGPGIDAKGIRKITDFSNLYSSRYHYKYPTRGALGNAWKFILGMTYALASATRTSYDGPPVAIISKRKLESKGKRYDITVQYDGADASANAETSDVPFEGASGTIVTISLPIYKKDWLKPYRYLHLIEGFAYFNPHAEIVFENIEGKLFHYPSVVEPGYHCSSKRLCESIHWFSMDESMERVEAEIRDGRENGTHPWVSDFIRSFRGLSSKKTVHRVLSRVGIDDGPLEDLEGNPELIRTLCHVMREECKPPSPLVLDVLCEENIRARLMQIDGILEDSVPFFKYKCKRGVYWRYVGESLVSVPFVVEVAVAVNMQNGRFVHIGVNGSPKLGDPFGPYVFKFEDKKGEKASVTGIRGILEKNGVGVKESVTVLVHIICPNIQYMDPGKMRMDIDPFYKAIKWAVDKASSSFKQVSRMLQAMAYAQPLPKNIKEAVFQVLPEAIKFVSSDGKFRYKQRQLWYVVRDMLGQRGLREYSPTYDYYANKLLPQAQEKFNLDLRGLLKEANAELHEPRSESFIPLSTEGVESYQIPLWKYNKILYVEKRGFKDVIVANRFHDEYDMAVIGSQGESSTETRKLLKRIEEIALKGKVEGKIDILCIHDADIWGHDIVLTLKKASQRMKQHTLNVIDLGLTMTEAVELGLKPEKVVHKKEKRIPKKLLENLSDEELFLLTGKKKDEQNESIKESFRVELNAFTPEQFMDWLAKKLEEHGVKRKVRPPDHVIADETQKKVDGSLEKYVKEAILELCGGQELVDKLKASIKGQKDLDFPNMPEEVDRILETYPTDGWDDIIANKVNEQVKEVLNDDEIRNQIRKAIMKRLIHATESLEKRMGNFFD